MPERFVPTEGDTTALALHLARYRFAARLVADKDVLDVACGTGYGSAMLASAGARQVTGVDIAPEAISHASAHFARENLTFVRMDVQDLREIPPVDLVVSFETIEHLEDPMRFLQEVTNVMKVGGELVISTPVRMRGTLLDAPENPFHLREWSPPEFEELLRKFFTDVQIMFQYNVPKSWYPFSRTLRRTALKILMPGRAREFLAFPVTAEPPAVGWIPLEKGIVVGLCRTPIATGA